MKDMNVVTLLREYRDSIMSFVTLAAALGWIIASDIRMRDQMETRIHGVQIDVASTGFQIGRMTTDVTSTLQVTAIEYAPMWSFLCLAVILTIWMLRS